MSSTVMRRIVHHVVTNSDLIEGKGQAVTVGWFLDPEDAKAASTGAGVFGSDARIESVQKLVVTMDGDDNETYLVGEKVIVNYENPDDVKARALAKLTAKERQLLGV